ncbi:MAG: hypothetical protein KDA90_06755 [Planctomycetaceae bacterium]|nr:hypothetical protein [Planctomycetaceae bacterium]
MATTNDAQFGTIIVIDATNAAMESAGYVRVENYRWTPPPSVRSDLPRDFTFELQCAHRPDGERVFLPAQGASTALLQGALGGLALLSDRKQLGPEERHSYRVMHFLFQAVQTRREFQRRRFRNSRDLYLRRKSRQADNERTVLPPFLGMSTGGRGSVWSITELMTQGAGTAREIGIPRPTKSQIIQCGLFAAAKRCPLTVPPTGEEGLMRAALFESGNASGIDETARVHIEERICVAIHQHCNDQTNTEFMNWLCGSKSSFLKQVAKQKKMPGGSYPLNTVRDVLLELGWQSFHYVADCFSIQAQVFSRAIPDPLTPNEQLRFDRIFRKHAAFGNLPLLLVHERLPEIKLAFEAYWEIDDETLIPVLHQLLNFYSFMSHERRTADRLGQNVSRAQQSPGGYQIIGTFNEHLGHSAWRKQNHTVDAEEANGADPELD